MKKLPFIKIIFLLFILCFIGIKAQEKRKTILEKIYTQTDRSFYFPGETIWFKSYIVQAENTISTLNDIMYAELISPNGSVVKTIKLAINDGYTFGDFDIKDDWIGGVYKIRTYTNSMRNNGDISFFSKKITIQKIVKPNLLLSLEFEKEGYGKSNLVRANFKVHDLKNNPLINSKINYTVSVKGNQILSNNSTTNNQGKTVIEFKLPDDLNTRDVVILVTVPYKSTTEAISKNVPVVIDTFDLQFFPESGKLLPNISSKVAFKAVDEFGKPIDIEGNITNQHGTVISSFSSFHNGMGTFNLTPVNNETYYANIKVPFISTKKIALPKTAKKGVNFKVVSDSLYTKLTIHNSTDKKLFLTVSNSYNTLHTRSITNNLEIINTQKFPIGITKFKITDTNNNPLAERLVFINQHKQLNIKVQLDKKVYDTREKVKATIITTDKENNPIPANLSVAIADNKLVSFANDKQDHILSYLLLSSELKGKIYKPEFYFNSKEEKSYEALDYVMLTHGWRNYITKPLSIENLKYNPESLTIETGQIIDSKGNPTQANLLLFDEEGSKVAVFKTNKKGWFSFKKSNNTRLVLLAYTEDKKRLTFHDHKTIVGYINTENSNSITHKKQSIINPSTSKFKQPIRKKTIKKGSKNISLSSDKSQLDEVVIVGYGTSNKRNSSGASVAFITSKEITNNNSLDQLLQGKVSGVQISDKYNTSPNISIRGSQSISGNSEPLLIIDDVLYPNSSNFLHNLSPNEIKSVSILKQTAATSLYGSNASNGVIVVETKNKVFNGNWYKKKINNKKFHNYSIKLFNPNYNTSNQYYLGKEFYIPKYEGKELPKERSDFRQTIYWNPVIQTDEYGKAEFEFYNSDAITSFIMTVEGIGYNGLLGRQQHKYATKKLLSVDFKTPNYMVLNDTITLPVTITNETKTKKNIKLAIALPKHLKFQGSFNKEIFVNANSSIIKNIKVIPFAKGKNKTIEASITSTGFSDVIKRKTTIVSPYFPTRVSVSGSKSDAFNVQLNNIVNNSIQADFTVYTDVIGDVMNGIESIIREPYGCFEQVSSSTYPNILVLKYLQETNKSNPEIEAKALEYIKKGYKKLAAYETSKDGFEWYGAAPPHEALTAYGLLEFTEMKEVFNGVSEPMLQRTIKYLLSRKNGKGGFKQNRGKYGFSAAPENVNNAYIVYAISESKIEADIQKEYNTTFTEALKSNDAYRMALLACASFNLNKTANAKLLIDKIKANINEFHFSKLPVDDTITRSYGNAKSIETVAFTLLALLKENEPDDFLITQGIEYLVNQRKYGRFGSTQSTSMALKALIEYTKTQKNKMIQQNSLQLSINGKEITKDLLNTVNGKVEIKNIESYFTKGNQNIKVQFSDIKNTFPYSLNITYDSFLPDSSTECPVLLKTSITDKKYKVGDNVSMSIKVKNKKNKHLGMVTSIIGIPSGTTPQAWQLKELVKQNKIAYYEIFDNYLVFYWRSLKANELKNIRLDLKADIAGNYKAPASAAYLYYGDEFKHWIEGNVLNINN
ncbi:TonB-dependent receptor plug domain-containing protein [Tenacibaculum sp. M341]|uniref:TonB-dependent receptor plug domain-containing protein n=1 Tax=Tenacibaculum sp. M341 TaxID=2530339 RepID=UPI0010431CE3|nr:TonB-dependent receptor plug domain-containing protein [Tenacibaculum sp. M341]TCI90366.1 hypothetical protein EYW44_14120 [Tenacibaculum sp. M341]